MTDRIPYRCRECNRRFFVTRSVAARIESDRLRDNKLVSHLTANT